MHARTLLRTALVLAGLGAIVVGCTLGSGGTGSAPPETDDCPAKLSDIKSGGDCNGANSSAPRVCCYVNGLAAGETGLCGGGTANETIAYCQGGADAGWIVETVGDAGITPSDAADAGETAADASDAADASETASETATDAADASETASETATDASDASESATDASDADEAG